MKKIYFVLAMSMVSLGSMNAQETYEDTKLFPEDLNGTARYVGMGGALDALGADISTIGTNPAGIGMFRTSQVTATMSVNNQLNAPAGLGSSTYVGFDQMGLVWALSKKGENQLNLGFNYKKMKDNNFLLGVSDRLNGASQNKFSYLKLACAGDNDDLNLSQLDDLYNTTLIQSIINKDPLTTVMGYNEASGYNTENYNYGYVSQYDFNVSGAINNRFYLGFTMGIYDVNLSSESVYTETLIQDNKELGDFSVIDNRRITGTGFDMKLGVIFMPIENSGFRIGASIATPTWYNLSTSNYTYAQMDGTIINAIKPYNPNYKADDVYDYKLFTPWKFGVSLGNTFGRELAVGISYQYADYSATKNRVLEDYGYDEDAPSYNDVDMNRHTGTMLQGVHTLKIGAEYRPTPEFSVRAGYNLVSSVFKKDAYKDTGIWSYGTYYSSQMDYNNWGDTNRVTFGLGYNKGHWAFDFAYQISKQDGTYKPFEDASGQIAWNDGVEYIENYSNAVNISKKRQQFMATLTYKF